ncbi:MAG: phosphoadenosine phosphosulfate reductase family protein, partial [Phycisphaerae bacterium]|nr:phosphoadenosine phosphosulfate reductase family protein [Phycisphaerae bacterium]
LKMSTKDIFDYMKQHDLPYHPLYEQGYLSIGCNPVTCTRPIMPGDDPRSGRWAGKGKIECGINVSDSLDSSKL